MTTPSNLAEIEAAHPYIGPLMVQALNCLCQAASGFPNPPQHCSYRIGAEAPHDIGLDTDYCCEGLAYVTLGDLFPSSEAFPDPDITYQARANCAPYTWGVPLKLSLVRCAPVGDGMNVIPNSAWEDAALQNIYDTRTLMKAACCLRTYITTGTNALFVGFTGVIGNILQGSVMGGCIERSVTVTAQIGVCDCF